MTIEEIVTMESEDRVRLAKDCKTSSDILAVLAKDEDWLVRSFVAENRNASVEILAKLAEDAHPAPRFSVAGNENSSAEIFAKLAKDEDEDVRRAVARNSNVPVEVLAGLAKNDHSYKVLLRVAENSNTSEETLAELVFHHNDSVDIVRAVAKSSNVSLETLAELANNKHMFVRIDVARNLKTPLEILVALAKDEKKNVRSSVAKNSSFRSFLLGVNKSLKKADTVIGPQSIVVSNRCLEYNYAKEGQFFELHYDNANKTVRRVDFDLGKNVMKVYSSKDSKKLVGIFDLRNGQMTDLRKTKKQAEGNFNRMK